MKKILLLLLLAVPMITFGQAVKKCGSHLDLSEKIKNDPNFLEKLNKLFGNKELDNTQSNYPKIPGFTPTGDSSVDRINFQNAKANLKNEDLELYNKIIKEHKAKPYRKNKNIEISQFIKKPQK